MSEVVMSLKNIRKEYPGVVALNDINIEFHKGEVHALVGENGAGKSTLIKTISGAIVPDGGVITMGGQSFEKMDPLKSRELGIEVIYQEFNLMPGLSIAENVFTGNLPGKHGIIDKRTMEEKTREIFNKMGVEIDPRKTVSELTVAYCQMVEIAKALSKKVSILFMDEPTAPLTNTEVEILFKLIETLKAQGITIIYISHRMSEIFRICDRLTVMRDGNVVETMMTKDATREKLIKLMVGRELAETMPDRSTRKKGETLLKVEHLTGNGVSDISFEVHKGEVFGLAGLVGAGRTETAQMIFGVAPVESGKIIYKGQELNLKSPRDAIRVGIGMVPEDRKNQGVLLKIPIFQNISLPFIKRISKGSVISKQKEMDIVNEQCTALRVKAPSVKQLAGNLSGGNQQKVSLAKWLASDIELLILDEPTRGIDVGAKQEFYTIIDNLAKSGKAIILISSEMDEILGLSDRVLIMSEGEQTGVLDNRELTQEIVLDFASRK